jgi:hypothetical protein
VNCNLRTVTRQYQTKENWTRFVFEKRQGCSPRPIRMHSLTQNILYLGCSGLVFVEKPNPIGHVRRLALYFFEEFARGKKMPFDRYP